VLAHSLGGRQNQRRRAVVDPRGIAGGDALVGAVDRLEFGQGFQGGIPWMLVALHHGFAFFMGDPHRHDFLGKVTGGLRGSRALLAAQGERVLVGAGDVVVVGHVIGGLRHRIHTVLGFHQRVDKAPADGGVFQRHVARKRGIGLAHHEGRSGHRLDATGNHQLHLAAGNGTKRSADGLHARGAQTVEGHARHALRQAGQQQRHARHIAVVFAGLVGTAEEHLIDRVPLHRRVARHQRLDRQRRQVVGAYAG